MLSDPAKELLSYLRGMARDSTHEAKERASQRRYNNACARLMREEMRLVVNNGLSWIKWEDYGY